VNTGTIEVWAWAIASASLVALTLIAFGALRELAKSRRLKAVEFNWRRARLASEILERVTADRLCQDALSMLERNGGKYTVSAGHSQDVSWDDLALALVARTAESAFTEKYAYIQECFDALCDALEMCEHYVRTDLLSFRDVEFPLAYYITGLRKHWPAVSTFMHSHKYALAVSFVERFPHDH
jgi:hypothetical protein